MIRFYFFIFYFLLSSLIPLKATHIIGGYFHYEHISGDTYEISMTVYKDCQAFINSMGDTITPIGFDNIFGQPAVSPSVSMNALITIHAYNNSTSVWDSTSLYFTDLEISDVDINDPDSCLVMEDDLCVQKGVYSITLNLPDTTDLGYHLSYQRCCRNPSSINVDVDPYATGIVISGFIPKQTDFFPNSNPEFNHNPPLAFCLFDDVEYDFSATDQDGDVLVYKLVAPLDANGTSGGIITPPYNTLTYNPGFSASNPISGLPPFNLDSSTGKLTGSPTQLGAYIVGVEVAEYRNNLLVSKTIRDLRLYVVDCGEIRAKFDAPDVICEPFDSVSFTSYSSNVNTYTWDFGDLSTTDDVSNQEFPSYLYTENGIYDVELITNIGAECEDIEQKSFEFRNTITAEPSPVSEQCFEDNLFDFSILTSDYPVGTNLNWNFGPFSEPMTDTGTSVSNIHFTTPGLHKVTLTSTYKACESVSEIFVEVFPFIDDSIPDFIIECIDLEFTVQPFTIHSDYSYEWSLGGQFISNNPSFNLTIDSLTELDLELIITDANGCVTIVNKKQWLTVKDQSEAGFSISDTVINLGEAISITNSANLYNTIEYDFGDGNISTEEEPTHTFTDIGTYSIIQTVSNDSNCLDQELIKVEVRYDYYIYFPNVFTPNGDNLNDTFFPKRDGIQSYSLEIYDRWGKLVYDGKKQVFFQEWDGYYESGENGDEEVFNYFSTYITKLGEVLSTSGTVLLIK